MKIVLGPVMLGLVAVLPGDCAHAAAPTAAGSVALAPGEYELIAEDTSGWLVTRRSSGPA
jgi:hypothetical protein